MRVTGSEANPTAAASLWSLTLESPLEGDPAMRLVQLVSNDLESFGYMAETDPAGLIAVPIAGSLGVQGTEGGIHRLPTAIPGPRSWRPAWAQMQGKAC